MEYKKIAKHIKLILVLSFSFFLILTSLGVYNKMTKDYIVRIEDQEKGYRKENNKEFVYIASLYKADPYNKCLSIVTAGICNKKKCNIEELDKLCSPLLNK